MSLRAAPARSGRGVHLVLYDGVCGLCNSVCQFVLARDRHREFDFASLQSPTGRAWLARFDRNPDDLDTVCLITDYRTTPALHVKSAAALAIAARLPQPWAWLAIFRFLPRGVRDWLYDRVARRRYQWFGRYDACLIPGADVRQRFLDI